MKIIRLVLGSLLFLSLNSCAWERMSTEEQRGNIKEFFLKLPKISELQRMPEKYKRDFYFAVVDQDGQKVHCEYRGQHGYSALLGALSRITIEHAYVDSEVQTSWGQGYEVALEVVIWDGTRRSLKSNVLAEAFLHKETKKRLLAFYVENTRDIAPDSITFSDLLCPYSPQKSMPLRTPVAEDVRNSADRLNGVYR
jgi:hypothetical protein